MSVDLIDRFITLHSTQTSLPHWHVRSSTRTIAAGFFTGFHRLAAIFFHERLPCISSIYGSFSNDTAVSRVSYHRSTSHIDD